MKETDVVNTESKGLDVVLVVEYQNKYVDFQAALTDSVNMYTEFWRELMEENPDIQKLQILGTKITVTIEKATQLFKLLTGINPNSIRVLELYGNFLHDIVNDETESKRILERLNLFYSLIYFIIIMALWGGFPIKAEISLEYIKQLY